MGQIQLQSRIFLGQQMSSANKEGLQKQARMEYAHMKVLDSNVRSTEGSPTTAKLRQVDATPPSGANSYNDSPDKATMPSPAKRSTATKALASKESRLTLESILSQVRLERKQRAIAKQSKPHAKLNIVQLEVGLQVPNLMTQPMQPTNSKGKKKHQQGTLTAFRMSPKRTYNQSSHLYLSSQNEGKSEEGPERTPESVKVNQETLDNLTLQLKEQEHSKHTVFQNEQSRPSPQHESPLQDQE